MPPANDDFASATVLTGTGGTVTFSNVGATMQTGEPSAYADGNTVWFKFTTGSNYGFGYDVEFDTAATPLPEWDSTLELFRGTSLTHLTDVADDDDSDLQPGATSSFGTSQITYHAADNTTYYVRVDSYNTPGTRADAVLTWSVTATPVYFGPWVQPTDTEATFNATETTYSSTENVGPTDPAPDPAGTSSFGHGGVANGQFVQTNINPDGSLAGWQWQQVISVFGVDLDATVTSGAGLSQVSPDPSSWPPGAVNYEFEAAQGAVTGPLRLQVDTSLHAADFNDDNVKTADPTFDVFATESEIRRLDASDYDFSTTWPTFPGDVWPAQSVLAAATLLDEWVMARTSADITDTFGDGKRLHSEWAPDEWAYDLTVADLDPANTFVAVAALDVHTVGSQWALPYFSASTGAAKDANHALTAQMIVAYRPPRYRFLFNTPPVTGTLEAWAQVEGSVAPGAEVWG